MLEQVFLTEGAEHPDIFDATRELGYRAFLYTSVDDDLCVELTDNPVINVARMADLGDPFWCMFDFRSPGDETQIRFVDNRKLEVTYFDVVGPNAAAVRRSLEEAFEHDDRGTLLDRATGPDLEQRCNALFQLALAKGPIPEPHVLRVIRDLLAHEMRFVRSNTIWACAFFEWPALIPMLEAHIAREPEADLVGKAQRLVDELRGIRPDRMGTGRYMRITAEIDSAREDIWVRPYSHFPTAEERAAVFPDGANRYLVSSVPHVLRGLSLDDVIVAELVGDIARMSRIDAKSGHHTLRAKATSDRLEPLLRYHVRIEEQVPGCVAIDVPPEVDRDALKRDLDALEVFWEQTAGSPW